MNLKFAINDYIIIWNLLFQSSINESIHKLKNRLWINYKEMYNATYKERDSLLINPKNYIPDDDTIYNIVLETKEYRQIKKEIEKYRLSVLEIWDKNKKQVSKALKDILKFTVQDYDVFCISSHHDYVYTCSNSKREMESIILGKELNPKNPTKILVDIASSIMQKEVSNYDQDYKDIVQSVVELAIVNEFSTRISGVSHYLEGTEQLSPIKRQIYPYFLMYLGIKPNDMQEYMNRDKILFDSNTYAYEKQLVKINILDFIDFCIRNKKYICKTNKIEII